MRNLLQGTIFLYLDVQLVDFGEERSNRVIRSAVVE